MIKVWNLARWYTHKYRSFADIGPASLIPRRSLLVPCPRKVWEGMREVKQKKERMESWRNQTKWTQQVPARIYFKRQTKIWWGLHESSSLRGLYPIFSSVNLLLKAEALWIILFHAFGCFFKYLSLARLSKKR